jgi:hypothetical protein
VQQLLRWSVRIICEHARRRLYRRLSCRHVQSRWRDVVQQLQRWLCVPHRIRFIDTGCCDLCSRHLQCIWGDVMQ